VRTVELWRTDSCRTTTTTARQSSLDVDRRRYRLQRRSRAQAKTKKTPQEQAGYLIGQVRMFLNSKEAVKSAQYVLSNIDANSHAAKDLKKQFGQ